MFAFIIPYSGNSVKRKGKKDCCPAADDLSGISSKQGKFAMLDEFALLFYFAARLPVM